MDRNKFCAVAAMFLFFSFSFLLDRAQAAIDESHKSGTIENNRYLVEVNIGPGVMDVGMAAFHVKDKVKKINFSSKILATYIDSEVQKIFFAGENVFLVEGHFGAATGLIIGNIKQDGSLMLSTIRLGRYLLDPENTGFVYSGWSGDGYPRNLFLFKYYEAALSDDPFRYQGKVIFSTYKYKELGDLILNEFLRGNKGSLIIRSSKPPDYTEKYLLQYSFTTAKSRMVMKLDRHDPDSYMKSFQWNDKEKAVDIVFSQRDGKKDYLYHIYNLDDLGTEWR